MSSSVLRTRTPARRPSAAGAMASRFHNQASLRQSQPSATRLSSRGAGQIVVAAPSLVVANGAESMRFSLSSSSSSRRHSALGASIVARARAELKALIFDCDGVILESEGLHRLAYNAAFAHFDLRYPGQESSGPVEWSEEFYDDLQNKVGGGKPKMHHVFGGNATGYPSYSLPGESQRRPSPSSQQEKEFLVDTLQSWKSEKYQQMIASGEVPPRPGVLRLMDSAREAGLKIGVCSAATKSSVVAVLDALLGPARVEALDVFLAGDDIKTKKPNPEIYKTAAEKLGIAPASCVVVEDSTIGVAAAVGAGMRCVVTYTPSTASQAFADAERIVSDATALELSELAAGGIVQDDRVEFST